MPCQLFGKCPFVQLNVRLGGEFGEAMGCGAFWEGAIRACVCYLGRGECFLLPRACVRARERGMYVRYLFAARVRAGVEGEEGDI